MSDHESSVGSQQTEVDHAEGACDATSQDAREVDAISYDADKELAQALIQAATLTHRRLDEREGQCLGAVVHGVLHFPSRCTTKYTRDAMTTLLLCTCAFANGTTPVPSPRRLIHMGAPLKKVAFKRSSAFAVRATVARHPEPCTVVVCLLHCVLALVANKTKHLSKVLGSVLKFAIDILKNACDGDLEEATLLFRRVIASLPPCVRVIGDIKVVPQRGTYHAYSHRVLRAKPSNDGVRRETLASIIDELQSPDAMLYCSLTYTCVCALVGKISK